MIRKVLLATRALTPVIILLGIALLAVPAAAIHQPPQPPHAFYGAVTVRGNPAEDGLTVTATIDGATFPYPVTVLTSGGRYGDALTFRVRADNPDTIIKDGGVNGDTVVFYVNGVRARTYTFEAGGASEVNLALFEPRRPLPDPSTFIMVGSGLAAALLYFGFRRLQARLSRS